MAVGWSSLLVSILALLVVVSPGELTPVALVRTELRNAAQELEELCRVDGRVWDAGGHDQSLLDHLAPEITALEKTIGADDRQRHVVSHPCSRVC